MHIGFGNDGIWLTGDDPTSGGISQCGNPYRFTGRHYDEETGLYYYRARMYAPAIGRFLQPDPIGYTDSMNLYQFCLNNPITLVDPFGLEAKDSARVEGAYLTTATEALDKAREFTNMVIKKQRESGRPYRIEGREYSGCIYRDQNGSFGYTPPVEGTDTNFTEEDYKKSLALIPKGATVVAGYHSHTRMVVDPHLQLDRHFSGKSFLKSSKWDIWWSTLFMDCSGDIPFAIYHKRDEFMVNQYNEYWWFNYRTRQIKLLVK